MQGHEGEAQDPAHGDAENIVEALGDGDEGDGDEAHAGPEPEFVDGVQA